jgi:hypothetical protein
LGSQEDGHTIPDLEEVVQQFYQEEYNSDFSENSPYKKLRD